MPSRYVNLGRMGRGRLIAPMAAIEVIKCKSILEFLSQPASMKDCMMKSNFTLRTSRNLRRQAVSRALQLEGLEARHMLNVEWRNPTDAVDVNNDAIVTPLDALLIINDLSLSRSRRLPDAYVPGKPYVDTSGDQTVSPLDALLVINHLNANSGTSGIRTLTEQSFFDSKRDFVITLGQAATGARLYRMKIDANFGNPSPFAFLPDLFSVYLVDPANSSTTVLDRGVNGSSLFSLSTRGSEMAAGLVRWDGRILEIDLDSIAGRDTATLQLQLRNGDSSSTSRVTIRPISNASNSNHKFWSVFPIALPQSARFPISQSRLAHAWQ